MSTTAPSPKSTTLDWFRSVVASTGGDMGLIGIESRARGLSNQDLIVLMDAGKYDFDRVGHLSPRGSVDAELAPQPKPAALAKPTAASQPPAKPTPAYTAPITPPVRAAAEKPVNAQFGARVRELLGMYESKGAEMLAVELARGDMAIADAKDCVLLATGHKARYAVKASTKPAASRSPNDTFGYRQFCVERAREGRRVTSYAEYEEHLASGAAA